MCKLTKVAVGSVFVAFSSFAFAQHSPTGFASVATNSAAASSHTVGTGTTSPSVQSSGSVTVNPSCNPSCGSATASATVSYGTWSVHTSVSAPPVTSP
jgi:hypothetical protein